MNSTISSKLMLGVVALGGLMAVATPASADDYDNHGRDDGTTLRVPYNDTLKGIVIVQGPSIPNDDNHGNNTVVKLLASSATAKRASTVESIAEVSQRRARQAAADELRRLQD